MLIGTSTLDPYALCPSGDGWTLLQAFQNGWNPFDWHTPPAPTGLAVRYYGSSTNLCVEWNPSPGPVSNYVLRRYIPSFDETNDFALGGQTAFWDSLPSGAVNPSWPPTYQVMAQYPGGPSAWSAPVSIYDLAQSLEVTSGGGIDYWTSGSWPVYDPSTTANASVVRGPQGHLYLVTGYVPPGIASLRVSATPAASGEPSYPWAYEANYLWEDPQPFTSTASGGSCEVSATLLQGGFYELPGSLVAPYGLYDVSIEAVANDGTVSDCRPITGYAKDAWAFETGAIPFLDGRRQIKENAEFQLRAAQGCETSSFGGVVYTNQVPFAVEQWRATSNGSFDYSEAARTDYVTAGFHYYWDAGDTGWNWTGAGLTLDAFRPFEQNSFYANFLWSGPPWLTCAWSPGGTPLGIPYWTSWTSGQPVFAVDQPWSQFSVSAFADSGTTNPPASLLSPDSAQWLFLDDQNPGWVFRSFAGQWRTNLTVVYDDFPNLYGLSLVSVKALNWNDPNAPMVRCYPGDAIPQNYAACFFEVARPQLTTIDYYFARSPVTYTLTPDLWDGYDATLALVDPRPGEPGFTTSATTPVMIAPIGQPFFLTAWAKDAIANGYSGKYAYLEQYFDNACMLDGDGNVTTNSAGLLSPYGEFFPMQPGPAALLTLPDIDTGQQGTGVVNVIKLQLDVNHDGTMDLSFGGPDNTSQAQPFLFWINNDYDRVDTDFLDLVQEEDDLETAGSPGTMGPTPDCDYQWADNAYAIPCKRDLEDYTRLWIPGMKQLYETHTNLSFELSIRNNDSADGPAINLVLAVEPDGGTRYLTDTNVANDQISLPSGKCLGRIGPNSTVRLNDFFNLMLYPGTGAEKFIWCGARRGRGELVLQVKSGTNLLAETAAWLDLRDIKEIYERWTAGDQGGKTPTNTAYLALEDLPTAVSAFQYGPPETNNTPYILFVHGWNMPRWSKDRYAETAFKRLYWQGYQGRFGSFRWPTGTGVLSYDDSEWQAWKSAASLRNLLMKLNATYLNQVYLFAHSMGNVVTGEALRTNTALVNTYVAMEAAVPAHCYDPTTTTRSLGISDSGTPDRYAQYWTNGAPCYFSGVAGAANYVNFYNTNDYALAAWTIDQDTKPDGEYGYDGAYFYLSQVSGRRWLFFPQDTYEIFSYADEARCYALGAQPNVGGAFQATDQIELDVAPYNYGSLHIYHSAQFRSTVMQRWSFWDEVLKTCELKPR